MEQRLKMLLDHMGLGSLKARPLRVSGGYMHRMYHVETDRGEHAVKHLNPEVMVRPEAMSNFLRAEALERVLERAGLPIVPALSHQGQKMQEADGSFFYVFPWVEARALAWDAITAEHCRVIGDLLAQVHGLQRREERFVREPICVDWDALIRSAREQHSDLAGELTTSRELLLEAQDDFNHALLRLPAVTCISDADMDCKNVLWQDGKPLVIDLECLDWGHPLWDMFQLALSWSGGVMCRLDADKLISFIHAYMARYGEPGMDLTALYGGGYAWLEWLEYNVRRALGATGVDEEERLLGEREALATLRRIRHHRDSRDMLLGVLREL